MADTVRLKKRSYFKKIIFFLILGTAGYGLYIYIKKNRSADDEKLITETVIKGDIENAVTATGILEPSEYVDLGAQVSGTLQKINCKIGDSVKKGDLLAQIDPAIYLARVQQDEANLLNLKAQLSSSEAAYSLAEHTHNRNQKLFKANAVSEQVAQESESGYLQAHANLESLKAQIKQAEATLAASQANLSYTKIFAPIDGTVIDILAREGQTLNANQTTPNLMRLANLSVMTIEAKVSEADISKVYPGMDAYFTTLGNPDQRHYGKVSQVQPTPDSTNAPVFYNVLFNVDNQNGILMPRMTAQVYFLISQIKQTLVIPIKALDYAKSKTVPPPDQKVIPPSNEKSITVYILKGDAPEPATIQVGISNRLNIEVLSGLQEGSEIIIGPIQNDSKKPRPRIMWR